MPQAPQNLQNHTRHDFVQYFVLLVLLINLVAITWTAIQVNLFRFTPQTFLFVAVALAILLVAVRSRTNALKVQDRVIRLEERFRFAALLPESLLLRSNELTLKQVVALRFASDAELPSLIQRTLTENLAPKQIKSSIAVWRPDHDRV